MNTFQQTGAFLLCIVLCVYLSATAQNAAEGEQQVKIKSIVGKAEVKSSESAKWRPATVGMIVRTKWDIRTYVESNLELEFKGGTIIKLGENSVVNLSELLLDKSSSTNSNVKVASGQVWANVQKLVNKNSKFAFETPTAVAAIRGTRLGIKVDKSKSVIDVYEGKVSVRNKGSRRETMVTTKNRAVVETGQNGVKTMKFEDIKAEDGDAPVVDETVELDTTGSVDSTTQNTDTATQTIDSTTQEEETSVDTSLQNQDTALVEDTASEKEVVDTVTKDVELSISSPQENALFTTSVVTIKGTSTPGAKIICGSRQIMAGANGGFTFTYDLLPGNNKIVVTAILGTVSKQEEVTVSFEPPKTLFLSVTQPSDRIKINQPVIQVQGLTLAGAEISVDDNEVTVKSDGSFSHQVHIPDEVGEYTVRIVSRYRGNEMTVERIVVYEPDREKLSLSVSSPTNGQLIKTNPIRLVGKAIYRAKIELSGGGGAFTRSFSVSNADGSFVFDIPIAERDIGDYTIEVAAASEETGEALDKSVTVKIDIKSPAINTSVPRLDIAGLSTLKATKTSSFTARVMDQTMEDQITLSIKVNGSVDQFTLDANDQEKIVLEEGKNVYEVHAVDIAGNKSNVISGELYYLPGPLTIDIVNPDENNYNISDLPPMPNNTGELSMPVEIEIEDGIGNVPATILYCRINGANLKVSSNYIFTGKLKLTRGANNFLIEVEDLAGNREKKSFTITINE